MILGFLGNILGATAIVSALLLVAAVNTRRSHRVQQTWLPVVAIVFSIIVLIAFYRFNDAIDAGLESLSRILPWNVPQLGGAGLYLAENVLAIIAFAIIKLGLRPVFSRFFAGGRSIGQFTAARIYDYDPEYELWFVDPRHKRLRDLYKVLYWVSMGVAVLLIATAATFPGWPGFSAIAFPAIAALLIGEFYFAIDGITKEEYTHSIYGERDISRRVGNYGPLRRILKETFPQWVIGEGVQLSSTAALDSGYRVGEMKRGALPHMRLAGAYLDRLRGEGRDIDTNMAKAATDLMAGTSVLFTNPFYRDLTPYLALPVYHELLNGRRCLIIAGRDSLTRDLPDWMAGGLADISGVPHLWRVRQLDAVSSEDTDVGILRTADLHNLPLLSVNDSFFRNVGLIVLAEPSAALTTGQLGLELVQERCSRQGPVTIAAFDGNHDGLVDTLSHLAKTDLTEVIASPLPQGASSELVWRVDEENMHTSILPGVTRFLGGGTEIAAVALKFQVRKAHWVGGERFPVVDMRWIAQQYFAPIGQFADLELSQDALAESLEAVPNPSGLAQADNYFLIVEDEARNIYETVRRFATRATRAGFLNVICDDYLLRDYMVSLRDVFAVDPKAVPSIVPDYARTERNVTLRLLLGIAAFGLPQSTLEKQLDLPHWKVPSEGQDGSSIFATSIEPPAVQELRRLITKYTGLHDIPLAVANPSLMGKSPREQEDPVLELLHSDEVQATLESLGPAYFFVEDDVDESNVIGSVLLDHVYQTLLPGQFVTYEGKYYEVQSITTDQARSRVILRRAADHIHGRLSYRQLRSYGISNIRGVDQLGAVRHTGAIEVSRLVADLSAETLGYLQAPSRSDLGEAQRVSVSGVPRRMYPSKAVLRISLLGAPADVRTSLTVLLNEVFPTLFPHSHHYIVAVTDVVDQRLRDLIPALSLDDSAEGVDREAIFIVEDSLIDIGLLSAVERQWERVLEIITDYLSWNSEPIPPIESAAPPMNGVALFPERAPTPAADDTTWIEKLKTRFRRRRPASTDGSEPSSSPEARQEHSDSPSADSSAQEGSASQASPPTDDSNSVSDQPESGQSESGAEGEGRDE